MKQSAAITLRYAEGTSGMSRRIKVKLSRVQEILRINKFNKFDDVSDATWKTMIDKVSVNLELLSVEVRWRNPDVLEQTREFVPKEPKQNYVMPKAIRGIHLAPTSRDGQQYCPLFQQGTCSMDAETGGKEVNDQGKTMKCRLGKHQCAAVLRGGRACHGQQPARDCKLDKRHWKPERVLGVLCHEDCSLSEWCELCSRWHCVACGPGDGCEATEAIEGNHLPVSTK